MLVFSTNTWGARYNSHLCSIINVIRISMLMSVRQHRQSTRITTICAEPTALTGFFLLPGQWSEIHCYNIGRGYASAICFDFVNATPEPLGSKHFVTTPARLSHSGGDFNPWDKSPRPTKECRRHGTYQSITTTCAEPTALIDFFLLRINGLKSAVTILAEATPLQPQSFEIPV